jgi:hypothetical protein
MLRYFFAPAKKEGYWKYFLLGSWFWLMLMPVITTAEGIPHGLRSIGVIPPVFIISAWALYEFAQIIMKLHKKLWQHVLYKYKDPQWVKYNYFTPPRMRIVNFGLKLIVVVFVVALTLQTYFLYFVYAYNDPSNFYYFRSDLTTVSDYLVKHCDKKHTYLILDKFSVQTTDYLTSDPKGNFTSLCNVPYTQVDPENSWQLTGLTSADEIVFTQSSMFDTKKFKQYHPNFHLREEIRNKFGQSVMAVYKIDTDQRSSSDAQKTDLLDWRTYTSTQYGFEFKYPGIWKLTFDSQNNLDISLDNQQNYITIAVSSLLSPKERLENAFFRVEGINGAQFFKKVSIKIANTDGIFYKNVTGNNFYNALAFTHGVKLFQIITNMDFEIYNKNLNFFVESFKFTN